MKPTPLRIDFPATGAKLALSTVGVESWGATSPGGRKLAANNFYLTLDEKPFPVVSGEFLPQRYPEAEWRDALRAMRDAGVTAVSSYVFWGLVEPVADRFDFSGPNDIRRVAELCSELGLLFAPRIGPFNNSEYLLGGLPPWLYGMPLTERSNDPRYLERVARYFNRLGQEFDGLFWKDGGPIVLVQLENELSHAPNDWRTLFGYTATDNRGPEPSEFVAHMQKLRELAVAAGLRPPYFSMTGWGIPEDASTGDFLPTYGAYLDLHPQPGPNHVLTTFFGGEYPHRGRYPTAFCELGTGSPTRAAYRSRTPWQSVVVPALTRIASIESIFLGYYLYHGGTNPVRGDGFGWTTKEPAFPLRSYDFWAPISEFGERRESFHKLLPLNRFVAEFGRELADTEVVHPNSPVVDPDDDRLRTVVRATSTSAFLFYANYGNNFPLSDRDSVSFEVALAERTVAFPRHSTLRIATGSSGILPIGLSVGDVCIRSATAQPLARLGDPAHPVLVCSAPAGTQVEYTFADVSPSAITGDATLHQDDDGTTAVLEPDSSVILEVDGSTVRSRVVTIPAEHAEHSALVEHDGARRLFTSDAELSWIGDSVELSRIRSLGDRALAVAQLREPAAASVLTMSLPAPDIDRDQLVVESLGNGRALLTLADPAVDVRDLWLDVAYTGDLVRLFDAGTGVLVGDDFNRGIPWRLRLGRFAEQLSGAGLQLRVEPVSTVVDVANDDGILLDHAEQVEGPARIDGLDFLQRVHVSVLLSEA